MCALGTSNSVRTKSANKAGAMISPTALSPNPTPEEEEEVAEQETDSLAPETRPNISGPTTLTTWPEESGAAEKSPVLRAQDESTHEPCALDEGSNVTPTMTKVRMAREEERPRSLDVLACVSKTTEDGAEKPRIRTGKSKTSLFFPPFQVQHQVTSGFTIGGRPLVPSIPALTAEKRAEFSNKLDDLLKQQLGTESLRTTIPDLFLPGTSHFYAGTRFPLFPSDIAEVAAAEGSERPHPVPAITGLVPAPRIIRAGQ